MKRLLCTLVTLLLMQTSIAFASTDQIEVVIPEWDVIVNGQIIDIEHSQYPVIAHKGVTYFPMTYDYLSSMGLSLNFDSEDGLKIDKNSGIADLKQSFLGANNITGSKHMAHIAPFKVEVNGEVIDNYNEEYPILLFRDITYFPMTWRFAVEEFGWSTTWSDDIGFVINVAATRQAINTNNVENSNTSVVTQSTEKYSNNITEQVILRYNGITITAKSIDYGTSYNGPELKLLIENNTNDSITVQIRDLSVNGIMMDGIFSSEVASGKKRNDEISFMKSYLEAAGIEIFKDVEFKFHIFDSDSWNTIHDSEVIKLTASVDPSFKQSNLDEGVLLLDQNGVKIISKGLEQGDSYSGPELRFFIENNSNRDITIQARDVSVNGYMINHIFSSDIVEGKACYDGLMISKSDMEENGIELVEEIELYFHVFEKDGWDTVFDSDVVKILPE